MADQEPGWNVLARLAPLLLLVGKVRMWIHDFLNPNA
jgi:hypothetical protein